MEFTTEIWPGVRHLFPLTACLLAVSTTVLAVVHGQSTCVTEICSESNFGLYCSEGGVLHINDVKCGHYDREGCMVAKHNLMTLCTGQRACAAKGLRTVLRPCMTRPWSSVYVRVNYSCVPEAILTRTCSGDMEEDIGDRGAIIMSPGYPDSPSDVKYNFCHWSFRVPVWKNARISIQHLTSRQTMGRCDSPLLQLRYTLCNGGAYKTEKFCGVVNREKVRHACGRVDILAQGFDPQYDAGTKFLLTVNVDYPQNLREGRGNPMYTTPCGGQPDPTSTPTPTTPRPHTVPVVHLLSPTTTGPHSNKSDELRSGGDVSDKSSSPKAMSRLLKMVLVLTLAGIIIIGLLAAIIVVCLKTSQSGNYKLREAEALAIARRRSKETEATKFDHVGMNGHKPGKNSIEDLDEDLVINGLRDGRCENSPVKQHYMTIEDEEPVAPPNDIMKRDSQNRPDIVGHTYAPYATIDDVAGGVTSPADVYPRTVLYEEPDSCRRGYIPPHYGSAGDCDSVDEEYDNVPRTADVLADVEHYNVDGDDYAIVTKSRKPATANGVGGSHGLHRANGGENGGFHVIPKPVYVNRNGDVILADPRVNNRFSLGSDGEAFY